MKIELRDGTFARTIVTDVDTLKHFDTMDTGFQHMRALRSQRIAAQIQM